MQEIEGNAAEIAETSDRQMIEDEMKRVLEGPSFRSSPRCRQFLKFVVYSALDGRHDLLKERTIGVEVFGRDPAYFTEADSIVRVRASEVRRRLLQHYATADQSYGCRIEMLSGSYIPLFHTGTLPESPRPTELFAHAEPPISPPVPTTPVHKESWGRWVIGASLLLVVVLLVFRQFDFGRAGAADKPADQGEKLLEKFWQPAIQDSKPVLLCIGSPTTYTLSRRYSTGFDQRPLPEEHPDAPAEITGAASVRVPGNEIYLVRHEFVGAGDADLAVLLSSLFGRYGKAMQFELSDGTSYGQISDAPTVLIGAFSNRWTFNSLAKLPFVFVQQDQVRMIRENDGRHRQWTIPQLRIDGKTDEDFAIVTRLSNSDTGKFLVTAAGISGFGSRAAGYFLTRPDLLARGLDGAPADWAQKNIQFVLSTKIVDNAPTAPVVVARRIW